MSRKVTASTCPQCRQDVLAGDDADRAAFSAVVDPVPLDRGGELLAVVDGRQTYEIANDRLYRRDRWALRSEPRGTVVAVHRCGHPLPYTWRQPTPPPRPAQEDF